MMRVVLVLSCVMLGALAQDSFPTGQGGGLPPPSNGQPGFPKIPPPQALPPPNGTRGQPNNGDQGLTFPSKAGGINDRCSQDTECSIDGSYCKDKLYCACEEDRVASKDLKKCLTLAKDIGNRCEDDLQCTENLLLGSQCKNGACACRADHHYAELYNKNGCYKDKKIGEVCSDVNECTTKPDSQRMSCNSVSDVRVCECISPYVPSEDKTVCNGGAMLGGIVVLIVTSLLAKFIQ